MKKEINYKYVLTTILFVIINGVMIYESVVYNEQPTLSLVYSGIVCLLLSLHYKNEQENPE